MGSSARGKREEKWKFKGLRNFRVISFLQIHEFVLTLIRAEALVFVMVLEKVNAKVHRFNSL